MNYLKWRAIDAVLGLLGALAIAIAFPFLAVAHCIGSASDAAHIKVLRAGAIRRTQQERKRSQR